MKTFLITVLLAWLFTKGSALNCYHCSSVVSWEDCYKMLRNETCSVTTKGCMVTEIQIKAQNRTTYSFARGCAQQCDIESNPHCGQPHITCKLNCCHENMCNRVKKSSSATVVPTADVVSGADRVRGCCYTTGFLVSIMFLIAERMFHR